MGDSQSGGQTRPEEIGEYLRGASSWGWGEWLAVTVIFLAAVGCYLNSLNGKFVYDDHYFVENNQEIRTLTPWYKFFTSTFVYAPEGDFDIYRPLSPLSFALELKVHGPSEYGFHVTNVFLHAACAVLVFLVLRWMLRNSMAAAVPALIFAVHPANTESVAWIAQRSGLLCMLFFLLAFRLHLEALARPMRNRTLLVGVGVLYALSVLSKEMGITLPLALLVHDGLLVNRDRRLPRKKAWWYYGVLAGVAVVFFAVRTLVLGKAGQTGWHGGSMLSNLLLMLASVGFYVRLAVWPVHLSVQYPPWLPQGLTDPLVVTGVLAVTILVVLGGMFRRVEPRVSFGVAWFAITLLPVLNIIPIKTAFNDRFLYLPLVGLGLVVGSLVVRLVETGGVRGRTVVVVGAAVLVVLGGVQTVRRNWDWRDTEALAQATLRVDRNSLFGLTELGWVRCENGELEEAEGLFKKALERDPTDPVALYNLGKLYYDRKQYDLALETLEKEARVVEESGEHLRRLAGTYDLLTELYTSRGDMNAVKEVYRREIRVNPQDSRAYASLVKLLQPGTAAEKGEAIEVMKAAHKRWPADVKLVRKLAGALLEAGRAVEAARALVDTMNALPPADPEVEALRRQTQDLLEQIKKSSKGQE